MDTLREFLLERILEEEALAQAAIDAHPPLHAWDLADDADGAHFQHWNPWRVLSSCVAKRLIIAAHRDVGAGVDRRADPDRTLKAHACSTCGQYDEYAIEWPCYTLRVLALDWVDHPAYRQEWRPQRLSSGVGRAPAASASMEPATRATTALGVPAPAIPAPAASSPTVSTPTVPTPTMPAQATSATESRRPGQPAA
jgi:hypothetical protein